LCISRSTQLLIIEILNDRGIEVEAPKNEND